MCAKELFSEAHFLPYTVKEVGDGYVLIANDTGRWIYVSREIMERVNLKELDEDTIEKLFSCGFLEVRGQSTAIKNEKPSFEPTFIEIDLTEECTLRCKYCYASAGVGKKISDENLQQIKNLMVDLPTKRVCLQPSGGEPLLEWPRFRSLIEEVKTEREDMEIIVNLETNGTVIDSRMARQLRECQVNVGISIDGRAEEHNKTRVYPQGRGSYDDVIRSIEFLRDAGYERISSITIMNKANITDPEGLVDHILLDLKLESPKFNPLLLKGRAKENPEYSLTAKEYLNAKKRIFQEMVKVAKKHQHIKVVDDYLVNLTSMRRKNLCLSRGCSGGTRLFSIGVDGRIYPCVRLISDEYCLGQVGKTTLSEAHQKAKDLLRRGAQTFEDCQVCPWKVFCNAGCPGETLHMYGDIFRKSPFCDFIKGYYDFLLDFLIFQPESAKMTIKC